MFGLLTVATLLVSAITCAQPFGEILLSVTAALAATFGLVAIWLQVEQKRRPESWAFSRSASRVAMFLAVVFTVAVKLLAIG